MNIPSNNNPVTVQQMAKGNKNDDGSSMKWLVKIAVVIVAVFLGQGLFTGEGLIASGFSVLGFLLIVAVWHLVEICDRLKDKKKLLVAFVFPLFALTAMEADARSSSEHALCESALTRDYRTINSTLPEGDTTMFLYLEGNYAYSSYIGSNGRMMFFKTRVSKDCQILPSTIVPADEFQVYQELKKRKGR